MNPDISTPWHSRRAWCLSIARDFIRAGLQARKVWGPALIVEEYFRCARDWFRLARLELSPRRKLP